MFTITLSVATNYQNRSTEIFVYLPHTLHTNSGSVPSSLKTGGAGAGEGFRFFTTVVVDEVFVELELDKAEELAGFLFLFRGSEGFMKLHRKKGKRQTCYKEREKKRKETKKEIGETQNNANSRGKENWSCDLQSL